ncbi:MAG: hypothetical protein JSW61_06760 [Candidatus Thorarchaeota archaeon]|nr:MAG: hypothetical protein JSW61_06760 [Candidatus Thorarchaeota archaeon]
MSRKPIDVYRGLIQTQISEDAGRQAETVIGRYSDHIYAGQPLAAHLSRFVSLLTKMMAFLDSRTAADLNDLTTAIDILDYFASTTKWWTMTRENPSFAIRPASHDPREFILSLSNVQVGGDTLSRISAGVERLSQFLEDQQAGSSEEIAQLCEIVVAAWALVSGLLCRNQGRNSTTEGDFESAYDIVRILLFYIPPSDYKALIAIRRFATNTRLPQIAEVAFSPGFESLLESSLAARLERVNGEALSKLVATVPGSFRMVLTNSLRFLVQLQAAKQGLDRVEEEHYTPLTSEALEQLESMGISAGNLQDEASVLALFRRMNPAEGVDERLGLISRRLESLIVDSTGNRDFLLRYSRLVPRLISLLLLLSAATSETEGMSDPDIKSGLIAMNELLSD